MKVMNSCFKQERLATIRIFMAMQQALCYRYGAFIIRVDNDFSNHMSGEIDVCMFCRRKE